MEALAGLLALILYPAVAWLCYATVRDLWRDRKERKARRAS